MNTLLLDQTVWDLCKDTNGNIALASEPYALSQDVASEARLFQGECYYDTTRGVPYWGQVLGEYPPAQVLKSFYVTAARLVPGVVAAACYLTSFVNRKLGGQIQFTDESGTDQNVGF